MKDEKKKIYYISSLILLIILDQLIKQITINKNVTVIPNLLSITYTENYGIAFSLLQQKTVIILISVLLLSITTIYTIKKIGKINKIQLTSISLILAGGVSNFIDRITRGYVIDYINIELFKFPVFNLADIFITVSIIFLIITTIKHVDKE